jgi:hypothetical protein
VPCYRCGVRQTDPERGKSPWRRGVLHDQLVLVCPACQESGEWTGELESCARCGSVHLIRRLGQVECLDCGLVREPEAVLVPGLVRADSAGLAGSAGPVNPAGPAASPDAALAEEVGRALDRVLGRR